MSRYNADFPFNVAFPPQAMTNVLAEWLSKQGIKQAHIAETEKYAHVTFFFNGGSDEPSPNEERILIPSPKVATYDLKPEMSVRELAVGAAAINTMSQIGPFVAPFAWGVAKDATGSFQPGLIVLACVAFAMTSLLLVLRRQLRARAMRPVSALS